MEVSPPTFVELMERFEARPCPAPGRRDPAFVELGPRFEQALLYATAAHRQQPRKGTPVPYLSHLLGVASIVLTYGGNEDQAIAGLLHDTVEDCGVEHEPVIGELFGDEVLRIVLACTDARVPGGEAKAGWRERKEQYLHHLRELPPGDAALLVSCSDKLHNAQAILADLETLGLPLWDRFPGKTPAEDLWYYQSLAAIFADGLPGPLADRLRRTVDAMDALYRTLVARPATDGS
jgi:(p)ppGpp synthase/HD superfamily hydrolase